MAFHRQSFMNRWLTLFLGFQTLLAASHLTMMLRTFLGYSSDLFFTLNIFQVLSAVGLTGLLFSPFFFPEVLYGLPRYPESFLMKVPAAEITNNTQEGTGIGCYCLDSDYIGYIGQRIDSCMREFSPYCQPDFSKARFSVLTGIPVHHLSLYLNNVTGQSFSDFRNTHRVKHAKQMMEEGKMNEMTIEAIGLSSGFANRTTFYRVFKNAEGISPGEFAARNAKTI